MHSPRRSVCPCPVAPQSLRLIANAHKLPMKPDCARSRSTNAPVHINAIARHVGVKLSIEDWEKIGYDVPLLVNMQPAGEYLGEEYYRAGGLPAVMHELLKAKRIHPDALTINGKTMGENVRQAQST